MIEHSISTSTSMASFLQQLHYMIATSMYRSHSFSNYATWLQPTRGDSQKQSDKLLWLVLRANDIISHAHFLSNSPHSIILGVGNFICLYLVQNFSLRFMLSVFVFSCTESFRQLLKEGKYKSVQVTVNGCIIRLVYPSELESAAIQREVKEWIEKKFQLKQTKLLYICSECKDSFELPKAVMGDMKDVRCKKWVNQVQWYKGHYMWIEC